MHVGAHDRIKSFLEKPADPPAMPGKPDTALGSMGIYVFKTSFLIETLARDAADPHSNRDFGKDVIPYIVKHGKAIAHPFAKSCVKSDAEAAAYWRDVGTVDSFWEANIELTNVIPALDLYDTDWPIWTYGEITAPAKFVHSEIGRRGTAESSLVSGGCVVSGAAVKSSLLFTGVHVHSYASLEGAVVLPYVDVGRSCRLTNVIVDRGVHIPEGLVVGEDPGLDAKRFRRTDKGICLITQPMIDKLATKAQVAT
jgi:glucose-1-phosphate adenylyltransferase